MNRKAVLTAIIVAACATPEPLPEDLEIARGSSKAPAGPIIDSVPSGALLTHPKGTCRTPCRVDYDGPVAVTLGKEGHQAMKVTIPLGAADATIELASVGRITAVEETSLPDL